MNETLQLQPTIQLILSKLSRTWLVLSIAISLLTATALSQSMRARCDASDHLLNGGLLSNALPSNALLSDDLLKECAGSVKEAVSNSPNHTFSSHLLPSFEKDPPARPDPQPEVGSDKPSWSRRAGRIGPPKGSGKRSS